MSSLNIPQPEELRAALEELGSNAEEVATTLKQKGYGQAAYSCPIAKYLRSKWPAFNFGVAPLAVSMYGGPLYYELTPLPGAVKEFILDFNKGAYREVAY